MKSVRLGPKQYPKIQDLIERRAKVGKHVLTAQELDAAIKTLYDSATNKNVVIHGAMRDDNLVSYLVQLFPEEGPYWNMVFLGTDPTAGNWDYRTNGLDSLWRAAFIAGEIKRIPGVVWSLPRAWARSHEKTQRKSVIWPLYDIETYMEVPAGNIPSEVDAAWVFGTKPKEYDVLLRRAWPKRLAHLRNVSQVQSA